MKATKTTVNLDAPSGQWHVRVQIGEEVINRPIKDLEAGASDDDLRRRASEIAKDEGYEVSPAEVAIVR